jgi:hypothetical protein
MVSGKGSFELRFIDGGQEARCKPDPKYPDGMDLDISGGAMISCIIPLPYPAPRCGMYDVECKVCGFTAMVSVAGRADDPRSLRIPCKKKSRMH